MFICLYRQGEGGFPMFICISSVCVCVCVCVQFFDIKIFHAALIFPGLAFGVLDATPLTRLGTRYGMKKYGRQCVDAAQKSFLLFSNDVSIALRVPQKMTALHVYLLSIMFAFLVVCFILFISRFQIVSFFLFLYHQTPKTNRARHRE